jgi:hypothetical protein
MKKLKLQQIIKEEIQKILETSESEIIDALREKYKFDLKGVNDDEDYKNLSYKSKLKVKDYIRFDIEMER